MKGSEFNGASRSLPSPTAAKNGFCSLFAAYLLHLHLRLRSHYASALVLNPTFVAQFFRGGEAWGGPAF